MALPGRGIDPHVRDAILLGILALLCLGGTAILLAPNAVHHNSDRVSVTVSSMTPPTLTHQP